MSEGSPSLLEVLNALSDETRLRILEMAAEGEVHPDAIARRLRRSRTNILRHLKILCDAGILEKFEKADRRVYFGFTRQGRLCYEAAKRLPAALTGERVEVPPVEAEVGVKPRPRAAVRPAGALFWIIEGVLAVASAFFLARGIFYLYQQMDFLLFLMEVLKAIGLWILATILYTLREILSRIRLPRHWHKA